MANTVFKEIEAEFKSRANDKVYQHDSLDTILECAICIVLSGDFDRVMARAFIKSRLVEQSDKSIFGYLKAIRKAAKDSN
jgi:hypothetical protein